MPYIYLAIAIIFEVIGTITLKATEGFTKITPSLVVLICYLITAYLMALAMKSIPVGISYAIWAGLGLLLVVVFSALIYKQIPDTPAILGVIFICLGIFIIQLFSNMIHG